MARTVTFSQSGGVVPYIKIYINGVDYSSRLEYLEHHEEAYRDRAIIGLNNRDSALNKVDLDGHSFDIGYGYGGEKVDSATLWVKSHQIISLEGERIYQIYAEGAWMALREQKMIAGITGWAASTAYILNQQVPPTTPNGHIYKCTVAGTSGATEPTWPTTSAGTVVDGTVTWEEIGIADPYSNTFNATHTVEGLLQLIIESMGWTWTTVTNSDGIIDDFHPVFDINQLPYENAAALLYRLIWMTKSYLRPKPSNTFEVVYPQATNVVNETYYSDEVHYFFEYVEKTILLVPNSIVVLCNQDPTNKEWATEAYPLILGEKKDDDQILKYKEIVQPFLAGSITDQTDATKRAEAILTRLRGEILGGRLIVPHDARVELYDRVRVEDRRG